MKYRIKVREVVPSVPLRRSNCFLGISVTNPFYSGQHVGLILDWVAAHFEECIILIGDHLHRINEVMLNGKSADAAIRDSLYLGDKLASIFDFESRRYSANTFKIHRWTLYSNDVHTKRVESELKSQFDTNLEFQASILRSCREFLRRQIQRGNGPKMRYEEAVLLSANYLLEEMAVFSVLIHKGYSVQVYLGSQLSVLKDFARGAFPDLDTNLRNCIYIDLQVK